MFNKKKIKEIERELADLRWKTKCLDSRIDTNNFIIIEPKMYHQSMCYPTHMTKEKRVSIEYVLRYILKELGLKLEYKCKAEITTYIKKENKKGEKK